MLLWFTIASAAPTVTMTDDNYFRGRIEVTADPATVRALIADPVKLSQIDASGTQVEVVERQGECVVIKSVSANAIKTVEYKTRQCPTSTGVEGKLVESNAFKAYRNEYVVTPTANGTRIEYQLDMDANVMVPQFVINRATRKGVENLLSRLEQHLGAVAAPQ